MISILKNLVLLVSCCLFIASCTSPYIGRTVKEGHHAVCKFENLPASCSYDSKNFNIEYEISQIADSEEYKITGIAKKIGGTTGTWTEFSKAGFILLLVNNGEVIEVINIAAGRGSFTRPINFSRTFKTENSFQATLISYQMEVSG